MTISRSKHELNQLPTKNQPVITGKMKHTRDIALQLRSRAYHLNIPSAKRSHDPSFTEEYWKKKGDGYRNH